MSGTPRGGSANMVVSVELEGLLLLVVVVVVQPMSIVREREVRLGCAVCDAMETMLVTSKMIQRDGETIMVQKCLA